MRVKDWTKGETIDASLTVRDASPIENPLRAEGIVTVVYASRGGGRNNDYAAGLELVLERLAQWPGANLSCVLAGKDELLIWGNGETGTGRMPLNLPTSDTLYLTARGFRKELGRRAAKVGRAPGAKGSGNATKRLLLVVQVPSRAVESRVLTAAWILAGVVENAADVPPENPFTAARVEAFEKLETLRRSMRNES